jgi:hypothetical protein
MPELPGIHKLPEAELLRLAKAIARADFSERVSRAALVLAKFGHLEGDLDALVGQEKRAALAIIGAILRERQRAPSWRASVAWAGPPPTGQGTRAPYELLVELIATAERSLLFVGVDLQRDARLLRSLHAAQRGRGLTAQLVLAEAAPESAHIARELFGNFQPWPELHAPVARLLRVPLPMCLIADQARAVLLAGAAPEVESPDRDLTAGILLEDAHGVTSLYAQWRALMETGAILPLTAAETSPT